jgi:membrane protease YdiL (CAAX protease family)
LGGLLTERPVPWTLRDCLWASVPAAILFGWSAVRRIMGLPTAIGIAAGPWRITAIFLITAAVWVVPVLIVAIRRGARASDLGFARAPWGAAARLVGTAFLVYWGFSIPWQIISMRFGIAMQPNMLKKFPDGWPGLVLALFLGAVIAPISEETFFRGFIFAGLRRDYPFGIAAGVSSLIFAVGHMVPGAILPLYVLGFLFAWLRERTGSIWPSIAMHMLNNALYFGSHFAQKSLANQTGW